MILCKDHCRVWAIGTAAVDADDNTRKAAKNDLIAALASGQNRGSTTAPLGCQVVMTNGWRPAQFTAKPRALQRHAGFDPYRDGWAFCRRCQCWWRGRAAAELSETIDGNLATIEAGRRALSEHGNTAALANQLAKAKAAIEEAQQNVDRARLRLIDDGFQSLPHDTAGRPQCGCCKGQLRTRAPNKKSRERRENDRVSRRALAYANTP